MIRKKIKIQTLINVVLILYLLISLFFNMSLFITGANIDFLNLIQYLPLTFLLAIFKTVFDNIFIITIYFVVALATKHFKKDNLLEEDINLKTSLPYFRDVLKEVSPAAINFINTYEFNDQYNIIAILLNLKLKNKIQIQNKKITILDENLDDLIQSEIVVMDMIKTADFNSLDKLHKFNDVIIKETYDKGYIINRRLNYTKLIKRILLSFLIAFFIPFVLIIITVIFSNSNLLNSFLEDDLIIIIIIFIIGFIFMLISSIKLFGIVYSFVYIKKGRQFKFVRTKEGELLNQKINGLKRFLNDVSNLNEKEIIHVKQWDEYLIYSVIFGQNKNIVSEMCEIIDNQFSIENN